MSICLIIVNRTHLIVNTNLQIWDRVTARVNWQIFNHIILMSRKTLLGTLQDDSRQAYVRMGASVSPSMSEGVVSTQNILSLKIFYWDLADLGQPFKGHSSIMFLVPCIFDQIDVNLSHAVSWSYLLS